MSSSPWIRGAPQSGLAGRLRAQRNLKTAIIDIDPQRSAYLWKESRPDDRKLDAVAADISQLAGLLQQAACEAFVRSQAGEGWKLIRTAYDDGGFSGGTMG